MAGIEPKVTVIIVTWNALPLLKQCLPSVVDTRYPNLEIVIADNASDDGSREWVEATYPAVRVIRHPENWAFCRGNNEAIRQTEGTYVVLLNNDVEVPPDWLGPLVERAERDAEIAAVQPSLHQYGDRDAFEYAGAAGGYIDRLGYPFTRGRIFFDLEKDLGQYDDVRDVFWATGAALLLRRSALDQVGLLDEQFYMHMEEIDLCWRLHRHGYRVVVEPASRVYHIGGGSLPQGNARKTYFNFRNSLLMLYKNLPARAWWITLAQRAPLDAAAAVRALLTGNRAEAGAIGRAYLDAHRAKARYREHRPTQGTKVFPPYRGLIVVDYFLRKRRKFSDLPPSRFSRPSGQDAR